MPDKKVDSRFPACRQEGRGNDNVCWESHKRASALLISMILMSVLVVLAVSFNAAIIRQMRVEYNFIQSGQAFYAAEAGVERAMREIEENLPGYESSGGDDFDNASYSYTIYGQDESSPCNFKKINEDLEEEDYEWNYLDVNETVRIPLFKEDLVSGNQKEINEFTVHFYVENGDVARIAEGDVIRWKIIGTEEIGFKTVSISDYYPEYNPFSGVNRNIDGFSYPVSSFGTKAENHLYTVAKNVTVDSELGTDDSKLFFPDYPISRFLELNRNCTLILTNVVNLYWQSVSKNPDDNKIAYRIEMPEDSVDDEGEMVCNFTRVSANGRAGDMKQSLDVDIALDSFMPVFDFALYRTR